MLSRASIANNFTEQYPFVTRHLTHLTGLDLGMPASSIQYTDDLAPVSGSDGSIMLPRPIVREQYEHTHSTSASAFASARLLTRPRPACRRTTALRCKKKLLSSA
jgi:hypothetical protein